MILENYISDLLYRHQCVVVPGFGAFITEEVSATYHPSKQTFTPPSKSVYLNTLLKNNDGLLAQHIAKEQKNSYNEAMNFITAQVATWQQAIEQKNLVELSGLGTVQVNEEGVIGFQPYGIQNYLTSSFGLSNVMATKLAKADEPKIIPIDQPRQRNYRKYLRAAAAIFVGATAWMGYNNYQEYNHFETQKNAVTQAVNEQVQQQLQQATFFIEPPQVSFETPNTSINHHLIAGAFRTEKRAAKLVEELKQKGFENAYFLPKTKHNLYPVAYASYNNEAEARKVLKEVQNTDNKEAWLLIEDQNQ